jgi:hypothetical protein
MGFYNIHPASHNYEERKEKENSISTTIMHKVDSNQDTAAVILHIPTDCSC